MNWPNVRVSVVSPGSNESMLGAVFRVVTVMRIQAVSAAWKASFAMKVTV